MIVARMAEVLVRTNVDPDDQEAVVRRLCWEFGPTVTSEVLQTRMDELKQKVREMIRERHSGRPV